MISRATRSPTRPGAIFTGVSRQQAWLWGLMTAGVLLVAWWAVARLALVNPYFLPSPGDVVMTGIQMASDGTLWTDTGASVRRIAIGFALSLVVALPVGVAMGTSGRWAAVLEPLVDLVRYMPAVAFVPLTIVWFGVAEPQKWSLVFIGTFFQQVLLVVDDVKRTPREYVRVGETLGWGRLRLIGRVVLPASGPALFDTVRITVGWAWTWLVVAELVAAPDGLGHELVVAQRYLETDRIFFVIVWIGLLGLGLDQVLRWAGRRLFWWSEGPGR